MPDDVHEHEHEHDELYERVGLAVFRQSLTYKTVTSLV